MKMKTGKFLSGLAGFIFLSSALASGGLIDSSINEALRQGRDLTFTESVELGKIVVAIGVASGDAPNKTIEKARQQANVVLAGFLSGKTISAADSSTVSSIGNETLVAITSASTVSVDALMRGTQVYKVGSLDDEAWFVALVLTEKAKEFEDLLAKRALESTIQSKGFSAVDDDLASARRSALTDALRNAVEAFSGVAVATKAYVQDAEDLQSNVATVSAGRVTRYEIVEENQSTGRYYVLILAEVEERPPGASDNISALLESMGRPSFFISSEDKELEILLHNFLDDQGFDIADSEKAAQYLINADTHIEELPVRFGNGEHYSTRTKIDLTLTHSLNADILLAVSNNIDESVDISKYPEVGRRNSLNFAFEELADTLARKMKSLMVSEFNNGTKVLVSLMEWFGLRDVDAFERCLKTMPDIKTVSQRPIDTDRVATFEVIYMGDPGGLQVDFRKHALSCDGLGKVKLRKGADGQITFVM